MNEKVGDSFERRAHQYDNPVTAYIGERELRVIRKLVPANSQVLDYGCGTGRSALDHARRGCRVTAYDLSPHMLSFAEGKARQQSLDLEFTCNEGDLRNRKWPVVTSIGVLEYYPNPGPFLHQLQQYLEDNGRLVLTWTNAHSPIGWLYFLLSRFTTPATPRTPAFVRQAARDAGLQVCEMLYAFPRLPILGFTLVIEVQKEKS